MESQSLNWLAVPPTSLGNTATATNTEQHDAMQDAIQSDPLLLNTVEEELVESTAMSTTDLFQACPLRTLESVHLHSACPTLFVLSLLTRSRGEKGSVSGQSGCSEPRWLLFDQAMTWSLHLFGRELICGHVI